MHRWQRLVTLATMFLQYIQVKNFLLAKMPKETIDPSDSDSEYEKIPTPGEDPKKAKESKPQPWRVLNYEGVPYVVGQELTPGQGVKDKAKITHNPQLCQHPSEQMCVRGGRAQMRWWYCIACGSRWQRVPLSVYVTQNQGTMPSGSDIACFGKHLGKTYRTIYKLHPAYCDWILKTAESGDESCAQLKRFAKWVAATGPPDLNTIPAGRMDEPL